MIFFLSFLRSVLYKEESRIERPERLVAAA